MVRRDQVVKDYYKCPQNFHLKRRNKKNTRNFIVKRKGKQQLGIIKNNKLASRMKQNTKVQKMSSLEHAF